MRFRLDSRYRPAAIGFGDPTPGRRSYHPDAGYGHGSALLTDPLIPSRDVPLLALTASPSSDTITTQSIWTALHKLVQRYTAHIPTLLCVYGVPQITTYLPLNALWPCPVTDLQVLAHALALLTVWHHVIRSALPTSSRVYDAVRLGAWQAPRG